MSITTGKIAVMAIVDALLLGVWVFNEGVGNHHTWIILAPAALLFNLCVVTTE